MRAALRFFWISENIYLNALNDIRYLGNIDFKDQIHNSQKMVYLILGHPVQAVAKVVPNSSSVKFKIHLV